MTDVCVNSITAVCTIASANYAAYAKTLASSLKGHEPSISFFLLVVDRKTPEVQIAIDSTGLNVIYAEDLDIVDFDLIAFKYDIVELNTALKPTMLKTIFALGYEKVLYLDPDIRIYSALTPVLNALSESNIVLTPHTQAAVMDGCRPSDIDFLRAGAFNLGFIGLRASDQTSQMLDWWEDRCLSYGFSDVAFGTFVDQKWMDLVPCYYEGVHILKHLGCNVAYWNLHERKVSGNRSRYMVGGEPLCFFHFSGVKADEPNVLSKYQSRHNISAGTALSELVADYCDSLNANGHIRFSDIAYGFSHFDNNIPITPLARRAASFVLEYHDLFSSSGGFYAFAKKRGFLFEVDKQDAKMTTSNFDESSARVQVINRLIRFAARIMGAGRFSAFIRYMSILAREANLARVLSSRRFDFSHSGNKTRRL